MDLSGFYAVSKSTYVMYLEARNNINQFSQLSVNSLKLIKSVHKMP